MSIFRQFQLGLDYLSPVGSHERDSGLAVVGDEECRCRTSSRVAAASIMPLSMNLPISAFAIKRLISVSKEDAVLYRH